MNIIQNSQWQTAALTRQCQQLANDNIPNQRQAPACNLQVSGTWKQALELSSSSRRMKTFPQSTRFKDETNSTENNYVQMRLSLQKPRVIIINVFITFKIFQDIQHFVLQLSVVATSGSVHSLN